MGGKGGGSAGADVRAHALREARDCAAVRWRGEECSGGTAPTEGDSELMPAYAKGDLQARRKKRSHEEEDAKRRLAGP